MEYKNFTLEQLERAKNADIIEFLRSYRGYDFKKTGRYYQCSQHSSLVVYADRKGWVWNSQSMSGGDTIDFLRKVEGKSFPEAIEMIIGEAAAVSYVPAPMRKTEAGGLVLPDREEGKYTRVFAYLSQARGIAPAIISEFMRSKQLYQDKKGNCVFVGYDEQGTARFASVRGTLTDKKYRGDCRHSDKRYAFHQMGSDRTKLYIFESPIDLMSHCTMTDMTLGKGAHKQHTRLALSGSSDVALEAFLERHREIRILNFRLDNDETGRAAAAKYTAKYQEKGFTVRCVFSKGKDVNEDLIRQINQKKNTKPKR